MTPRQARTERRTAERKAKKLEIKKAALDAIAAPPPVPVAIGFVSQNSDLSENPSPETAAEIKAIRDTINAGLDSRTASRFVSQKTARAEINRQNAQHSTGPRSADGKTASSHNSLKHGLASG
ncbi:MAG: hypothetical protein WB992_07730 [Bryobacteraceae bacterium]